MHRRDGSVIHADLTQNPEIGTADPSTRSRAARKSPKSVAGSASASRRSTAGKKQFAGLGLSELRELRSLRHENSKLKQVVADLTLDLRDECLNAHVFNSTIEAQRVLDAWRHDYNHVRPNSALQDRTPGAVGALWVDSRDARESTAARKDRTETEIAGRFVTVHRGCRHSSKVRCDVDDVRDDQEGAGSPEHTARITEADDAGEPEPRDEPQPRTHELNSGHEWNRKQGSP
jgi:Integrase core domain